MIGATEIVIVIGLGTLIAYFVKEIRKNKKEAAELKDRMEPTKKKITKRDSSAVQQ